MRQVNKLSAGVSQVSGRRRFDVVGGKHPV